MSGEIDKPVTSPLICPRRRRLVTEIFQTISTCRDGLKRVTGKYRGSRCNGIWALVRVQGGHTGERNVMGRPCLALSCSWIILAICLTLKMWWLKYFVLSRYIHAFISVIPFAIIPPPEGIVFARDWSVCTPWMCFSKSTKVRCWFSWNLAQTFFIIWAKCHF